MCDNLTNHFKKMSEMVKMDILKRWEDAVQEDAPANSAGGGGVAGIGIGPKGEPGVDLRKKKLDDMTRDAHLDETVDKEAAAMNDEQQYQYLAKRLREFQFGPMGFINGPVDAKLFKQIAKQFKELRKKLKKDAPPQIVEARTIRLPKGLKNSLKEDVDPRLLELRKKRDALLLKSRNEKNTKKWHIEFRKVTDDLNKLADELRKGRIKEDNETFAGAKVFEVDMDKVMSSRFGKNRYHRYSKYVGEDEKGEEIRQHGRSRGSGDIILKDSKTSVMTYLRRKKPVGQ